MSPLDPDAGPLRPVDEVIVMPRAPEVPYRATETLYLTRDGRAVGASDPGRHQLLVTRGGTLPAARARALGLLDTPAAPPLAVHLASPPVHAPIPTHPAEPASAVPLVAPAEPAARKAKGGASV